MEAPVVIAEVLAPDPRCLRRRCSKLHAAGAAGHVRSRLFVAGRRALPGLLSLGIGSSKPKPRWSHGGEGGGHASRETPGAAAAAVGQLAAAGGGGCPFPVPRAAKPEEAAAAVQPRPKASLKLDARRLLIANC
jgi:hypothetical protein